MPKYRAVLFDFDGTLADSAPAIMASLQRMFQALNRPLLTDEQLRACVGPPIHQYFREILGFHENELDQALAIYRGFFIEEAARTMRPFDGVIELLRDLKAQGVILAVATCKVQTVCVQQAEDMGFAPYLDIIGGAIPAENLFEKADIIRYVLDRIPLPKEDAVMVGDRMYDLIGANEAGIAGIGVLHGGCGTREELEAYHPRHIAANVEELRALLLS